MASVAETSLAIAIVGAAVTVAVGTLVPNGVVSITFAMPKADTWTVTEWLGLGTLATTLLTCGSGPYFTWRADRRATREFEQRIAALEEKTKQE